MAGHPAVLAHRGLRRLRPHRLRHHDPVPPQGTRVGPDRSYRRLHRQPGLRRHARRRPRGRHPRRPPRPAPHHPLVHAVVLVVHGAVLLRSQPGDLRPAALLRRPRPGRPRPVRQRPDCRIRQRQNALRRLDDHDVGRAHRRHGSRAHRHLRHPGRRMATDVRRRLRRRPGPLAALRRLPARVAHLAASPRPPRRGGAHRRDVRHRPHRRRAGPRAPRRPRHRYRRHPARALAARHRDVLDRDRGHALRVVRPGPRCPRAWAATPGSTWATR